MSTSPLRYFVKLRERLVARGDEADLAWVLCHLAVAAWLAGNLAVAEREADEAERVAALNGVEIFRAFALMLRTMIRALRGNTDGARADGAEGIALSDRIGWPVGSSQTRWGLGFLALSEGDPAAAVAILDPVIAQVEALAVYEWPIAMALPDAIEALVATGEIERATRLTGALANCGRTFDRPWALATSGRCRALLLAAAGDLDGAVAAAEQALVEHERLPMPFELGADVARARSAVAPPRRTPRRARGAAARARRSSKKSAPRSGPKRRAPRSPGSACAARLRS